MKNMEKLKDMLRGKADAEKIHAMLSAHLGEGLRWYEQSVQESEGAVYCAVRSAGDRYILICSDGLSNIPFKGKEYDGYILCPWNPDNAEALRSVLPFTRPVACGKERSSFGTGDRLGIAGPAHVRCIRGMDIFPVLAQQSMRELSQTERSYRDVIDSATWAVFQEGYTQGFGADGDHLKTLEEIQTAVETGVRMVTLDLSDVLKKEAFELEQEDLESLFEDEYEEDERETLLNAYENQEFFVEVEGSKLRIKFLYRDVLRNVLCYYKGIELAEQVYMYLQHGVDERIDFEISIDEVGFPTEPKSHFFIASELEKRQISIDSLAPCFVGEFQKAIDYIGDTKEFRKHLQFHFGIAEKFGGYKLSIHSGSDKFSVYPVIGEVTGGKYHVKTAGTSWVEAVKMIASAYPDLYREVHSYALETFSEAAELYHVTTDISNIPALESVDDDGLPGLFDNNDARQLIHITYGFILRARNRDGSYRFRDRLYSAWEESEDIHYSLIQEHIGKHLDLLQEGAGS